jgi:hypothetical protein
MCEDQLPATMLVKYMEKTIISLLRKPLTLEGRGSSTFFSGEN